VALPRFVRGAVICLLKDVHRFIELNRATLIDYWEYRIDAEGLRQQLVSI
jgi:hypothetical protein